MKSFTELFYEVPTFAQQMKLTLFALVCWYILEHILTAIVNPLVKDKPWLIKRLQFEYSQYKKACKDIGFPLTMKEFISLRMPNWPGWLIMMLQHFVGGALCLPAIYGWVSPTLGRALCTFSANSEMGWEWQEYPRRLYRYFCKKDGHLFEHPSAIILYGIHHLFGLGVIPMNLYYYNEYYYWTLICMNQFAAAIAAIAAEYTFYLDINTSNGLRQAQVINICTALIQVYTRFFYYLWNVYNLMVIFKRNNDTSFLWFGGFLFLIFFYFNIVAVILPFVQRAMKFCKMEPSEHNFQQLIEEGDDDDKNKEASSSQNLKNHV